jgi:hypothetical protein
VSGNPKLKTLAKDLFLGMKSTASRKMDVIMFQSNGAPSFLRDISIFPTTSPFMS